MNYDAESAVTPWVSITLIIHCIIIAACAFPPGKASPGQWIVALLLPIIGSVMLLTYKLRAARK